MLTKLLVIVMVALLMVAWHHELEIERRYPEHTLIGPMR